MVGRALNEARDVGNRVAMHVSVVDLMDQLGWVGELHLFEDQLGQKRRRPPPIELPDYRRERRPANPESAAFIPEQIPPASCPRGDAAGVAAVRNRAGAGDDDHARGVSTASDEGHQGIVDDHCRGLEPDALHDSADDRRIVRAIHAGDAQTDRGRRFVMTVQRLGHHSVEYLLDLELSDRLEVGAAAARLAQNLPLGIGQQAHRLRSPRVDPQYVHGVELMVHCGGYPVIAALNWADYLVLVSYLLGVAAFGSWFSRFQRTTRDYFLTGHSVPWWAICFTIVATETSTLSFIGVPAAAYAGNMTFLQLAIGYIVGRILVSLLFIPAYFRGELFTSYELLQRRFGAPVKNLAAGIFLVTRTLADGVRLFATALVLSVVMQVPVAWTVVALGGTMIVYTVRGGAAAVIWTDVVQMFVYAAGAVVVLLVVAARVPGGWEAGIAVAASAGHLQVWDLTLDLTRVYTVWAGVIGGITLTLATHGTDQFLVQRLLAARSARDASIGLVLSGFIVFAQFVMFLVIGALLYSYYQAVPLPRPLVRLDEVLPLFVITELPHGLAGFIIAAVVAAALSPSINALAATTVNDFYLKYVRPGADEATLMRISRRATVGWGVAQIGVALACQRIGQSVLDSGLLVLSFAAGPVLGAFLAGVLTRTVGGWATVAGMLAGITAVTLVWWTGVAAWTWYSIAGAACTVVVALTVSPFETPRRASLYV